MCYPSCLVTVQFQTYVNAFDSKLLSQIVHWNGMRIKTWRIICPTSALNSVMSHTKASQLQTHWSYIYWDLCLNLVLNKSKKSLPWSSSQNRTLSVTCLAPPEKFPGISCAKPIRNSGHGWSCENPNIESITHLPSGQILTRKSPSHHHQPFFTVESELQQVEQYLKEELKIVHKMYSTWELQCFSTKSHLVILPGLEFAKSWNSLSPK